MTDDWRGLTLTQPWAQLVALQVKTFETRSWFTHYRGRLVIHAAKGLGPVGGVTGLNTRCWQPPFREALGVEGRDQQPSGWLPRGAVVAVATLVGCYKTKLSGTGHACVRKDSGLWVAVSEAEQAFGDYTEGRYAWALADVQPLRKPVPCAGAQGLWLVPADVRRQIRGQL